MYTISAILFILPWSLLFFSWSSFRRSEFAVRLPRWRHTLFSVGLVVGVVATVLNMAWNYSWLRHGGSPHGMGAAPGLWQRLGPFLVWTFFAATVLSVFGKRTARVLMIAWSVSMCFVFQFIYMLQFD